MPAEKLDRVRVIECVEMEGSGLEEEVDEMVRESLFRVVMFKQKQPKGVSPSRTRVGKYNCKRPRAEDRTSKSVVIESVSRWGR